MLLLFQCELALELQHLQFNIYSSLHKQRSMKVDLCFSWILDTLDEVNFIGRSFGGFTYCETGNVNVFSWIVHLHGSLNNGWPTCTGISWLDRSTFRESLNNFFIRSVWSATNTFCSLFLWYLSQSPQSSLGWYNCPSIFIATS